MNKGKIYMLLLLADAFQH